MDINEENYEKKEELEIRNEKEGKEEKNRKNEPKIISEEEAKDEQDKEGDASTLQIPDKPVIIVQATKSGSITIPKEIREQLPEKAMFAFWQDGKRLIFQHITEADIPLLKLKEKPRSTRSGSTRKEKILKEGSKKAGSGTRRRKTKTKAGPQPELALYFPFSFENQEKVGAVLESAFYKLTEDPPNIQESIERLKYALISYTTGSSTNDARLKNSLVLCMADLFKKLPKQEFKPILEFLETKVITDIKSKFLLEQSRIQLFIMAIIIKEYEKAKEYLIKVIDGIHGYAISDMYAIIQGWKSLISAIKRLNTEVPDDIKEIIANDLVKFIKGFEETIDNQQKIHPQMDSTNALTLIDLLVDLRLIELAYNTTQEFLNSIPVDDPNIEKVRSKLREIKAMPI